MVAAINVRNALAGLVLLFAMGVPLHAAPEAIDLPALAKKSRAAVLLLSVLDANANEIAVGTGFVISPDGRVVTNCHVIKGAVSMLAKGENGAFYKVDGVLAQDATNDIAILKLDANDLPVLPLGDSTKAEEGQQIAVIGSPLGLEGTLSEGIISANREADGKRILQISAPISPGSSGSPVLDANGEVIGVATAYLTEGQALNLAVPIEAVKALLPTPDAKPLAFSAPAPKPETQNDPNAALYYDPDLRALLTASIGCDYPKALKLANALVQRYPKSDEALDYQAQAFDKLGFDDDAIASYQNAVKLKPDDEDLWLSLAGEYSETKQWTAALNAAKAAIRLNPEDGMAWSWLGMAQDGLKDYPDAIVSYKRCVKLAPNDSSLLFPLASLKKDNCIRKHRYKSVFVAQENIRLYIEKFGEENIGVLTVTTPSECLLVADFQRKWHSFLTNVLRELFPSGMWDRERQPRSGNWHAHAVVNVGWDIKTGFPFDQVAAGFYANVDPRLRALWKELRERAAACGFGRIELLPLRHSGPACARYLTKYLAKSFGTEKAEGEEKCRLFGIWGGVRFVHSQFSFVSSRILRRKKAWLAGQLNINDNDGFKVLYGFHWWHFIGPALREVILPEDDYKIRVNRELVWDDLGSWEYSQDILNFSGSLDDKRMQSRFYVFLAVGKLLFGRHAHSEAINFAAGMVGAKPAVVQEPPSLKNLHFDF